MTKRELLIKAAKAYENAIYYANERENYKAFIREFDEGNALVNLAEELFDFVVTDDQYINELYDFCSDIYIMIDVVYSGGAAI